MTVIDVSDAVRRLIVDARREAQVYLVSRPSAGEREIARHLRRRFP